MRRRAILLGLVAASALAPGCTPTPSPTARPSPAAPPAGPPRQVTVFAIRSVPGTSAIDPRLSMVREQLRKILPGHGFELIVSRSERLVPGSSLACDLGAGRVAETTYRGDESGRVSLDCTLKDGDDPPFSTTVDVPENQLFFYERALRDGDRVLIGVGAR